jgi:hypothetical protein
MWWTSTSPRQHLHAHRNRYIKYILGGSLLGLFLGFQASHVEVPKGVAGSSSLTTTACYGRTSPPASVVITQNFSS